MFDRAALAAAIAAHGPVARVVVAQVQGSAPREVGAAMLVWQAGQSGTIGGGALEYQAAAVARACLQKAAGPRVDTIPLGPDLGQCCGGAVKLVTEVFAALPDEGAAYARAVQGAQVPLRLPMPLPIARAMARARRGESGSFLFADGWLLEPYAVQKTDVWIWGAGHVGRALVQVLAPLPDVAITWVDTDLARFPEFIPDGVRALPAPDLPRAIALAPMGAHHVILTFSHALDLALCHGLLLHGFAQCGLIGSATKWARFRSRLAQAGHSPAEILRITCPIGDPALGKHPQAIAIGVGARMMAEMMTTGQTQREARA
jgi:xanthine dehydrogenase accessory factor